MNDFKLTADNDLDMSGNDMLFVSDMDQLAQNLKIRLQTFFEEWYLDQTIGLPYFQEIFAKNPNETFITNYIKKVIKETVGIVKIVSFSFEYDNSSPQKRALKIAFVCETIYSKDITFILSIPIN
jgi:hypothetical protein